MNFKALAATAALLASASSHAYIIPGAHASTPSDSEFVLSIFDSAGKTYALDLGLSLATFADGTNSYSWTVASDIYAGFLSDNAGGLQWAVTGNDNYGANNVVNNISYYTTLTAGKSTTFAFANNRVTAASVNSTNYVDRLNQIVGSTMLTVANGEAVAAGGTTASFVTTGMNLIGNAKPSGMTAGNVIGATDVTFIKLGNSSTSNVAAAKRTVFEGTWAFDGTTLTYTGTTPAVPEPGTYALLMAGLAAVGFVARRRAA